MISFRKLTDKLFNNKCSELSEEENEYLDEFRGLFKYYGPDGTHYTGIPDCLKVCSVLNIDESSPIYKAIVEAWEEQRRYRELKARFRQVLPKVEPLCSDDYRGPLVKEFEDVTDEELAKAIESYERKLLKARDVKALREFSTIYKDIHDTNRMIYAKRTYYENLPENTTFTKCYIGVDYGWADYSSFAPILIDKDGEGWLFEEWKQNKTTSSEIVTKMKALVENIHSKYNIPDEDIHIVADSSHQQVSFDIYKQGVLNVQNAYKLDENYQIARVAEALSIGSLHIKKDGYFDQECNALVWKWDDEKGVVIHEIDDKTFHPDIADSVKYAWNTYRSDENGFVV